MIWWQRVRFKSIIHIQLSFIEIKNSDTKNKIILNLLSDYKYSEISKYLFRFLLNQIVSPIIQSLNRIALELYCGIGTKMFELKPLKLKLNTINIYLIFDIYASSYI